MSRMVTTKVKLNNAKKKLAEAQREIKESTAEMKSAAIVKAAISCDRLIELLADEGNTNNIIKSAFIDLFKQDEVIDFIEERIRVKKLGEKHNTTIKQTVQKKKPDVKPEQTVNNEVGVAQKTPVNEVKTPVSEVKTSGNVNNTGTVKSKSFFDVETIETVTTQKRTSNNQENQSVMAGNMQYTPAKY